VKSEFHAIIRSNNRREEKMRTLELHELMKRATLGQLAWYTYWHDGDVREIERRPRILELRWENQPFDDDNPPVLTRLYFSEPSDVHGLLLGLRFAPKNVHQTNHKQIQDADIDTAHDRLVTGQAWDWGR
jgi:hypothetical protein